MAGLSAAVPKRLAFDQRDDILQQYQRATQGASPLMQQARTQGLQQANRRGLLNSSLAVGASEDAAHRVALPIAQQAASQGYGAIESSRQRTFQGSQADRDRALAREQQKRDIASRETMAAKDRALSTEQQKRQYAFQGEQAGLDRGQATTNAQADFITRIESVYANQYQSIMQNENLNAKDRAAQIKSIQALRNQQLNYVNQMYDASFKYRWDTPVTKQASTPAAKTTTPTAKPAPKPAPKPTSRTSRQKKYYDDRGVELSYGNRGRPPGYD